MHLFFSTALTLFLVMDALGSIPAYLFLIRHFQRDQQRKVVWRELFFSLLIMLAFFFVGGLLLRLLQADVATVEVSGGVVLFLIASRLIFIKQGEVTPMWQPGAHFIVPIATPVIASPSLLATLMIYSESPVPDKIVLLAMGAAWVVSALFYLFAQPILRLFKDKGLMACQRLMGLLVALIAIQKLLHGIHVLTS